MVWKLYLSLKVNEINNEKEPKNKDKNKNKNKKWKNVFKYTKTANYTIDLQKD